MLVVCSYASKHLSRRHVCGGRQRPTGAQNFAAGIKSFPVKNGVFGGGGESQLCFSQAPARLKIYGLALRIDIHDDRLTAYKQVGFRGIGTGQRNGVSCAINGRGVAIGITGSALKLTRDKSSALTQSGEGMYSAGFFVRQRDHHAAVRCCIRVVRVNAGHLLDDIGDVGKLIVYIFK